MYSSNRKIKKLWWPSNIKYQRGELSWSNKPADADRKDRKKNILEKKITNNK